MEIDTIELERLRLQLTQEFAKEKELEAVLENQRATRLRLEGVVIYLTDRRQAQAAQAAQAAPAAA